MLYYGFYTLVYKELLRFYKVPVQTVLAPIVTSLLYLLVFSQIWHVGLAPELKLHFLQFLIPGLMMMSILQNAFANASSSLVQAKIIGHIIFLLLSPLSNFAIYLAYIISAMLRGLAVGVGFMLIAALFIDLPFYNPLWIIWFAIMSGLILGAFGVVVGILADRFDEMAVYQNFVILPLSFLSGVFYSVKDLPVFWQILSHFNPLFYMIDGFRYGFLGVADVSPWISLVVSLITFIFLTFLSLYWLNTGYKLRS